MITLNLLSPRQRRALQRRWALEEIRSMGVTLLFTTLVCGFLYVSARHLLADTADLYAPGAQPTAAVAAATPAEQGIAALVARTLQATPAWSLLLTEVARTVPPEVNLKRLNIDAAGTVTLEGLATNRDTLLAFQNSLQRSGLVSNLYSPVKNLLQRTNINFELTAQLATSTRSAAD